MSKDNDFAIERSPHFLFFGLRPPPKPAPLGLLLEFVLLQGAAMALGRGAVKQPEYTRHTSIAPKTPDENPAKNRYLWVPLGTPAGL